MYVLCGKINLNKKVSGILANRLWVLEMSGNAM